MNVLVLNCGSSSIKYQLLNMEGEPTLLAKGLVEKIGLPVGSFTHKPEGQDKYVVEEPIKDHTAGIDLILKALVNPQHGENSLPRALSWTLMPKKRLPLAANWHRCTIPLT